MSCVASVIALIDSIETGALPRRARSSACCTPAIAPHLVTRGVGSREPSWRSRSRKKLSVLGAQVLFCRLDVDLDAQSRPIPDRGVPILHDRVRQSLHNL